MQSSWMSRKSLFFFGLILSLGLITSVYIATKAIKDIKLNNGSIVVKGYAEKKIVSDFARWTGTLSTTNIPTIEDAYNALEENRKKIINFFNQKNIDVSKDLVFSSIYVSPIYKMTEQGSQTHEIEGYKLTQDIVYASNLIAKVTSVSQEISELLKEGVFIMSYAPQYFYQKLDQLKIEMLGEAAKDAKNRANELANNCDAKTGNLKSAQQGVFQITPAYSTNLSDYGENDTSAIEKSIKAVVTMEFGLKN